MEREGGFEEKSSASRSAWAAMASALVRRFVTESMLSL